jgi:hypothetical protein
MEPETDVKTAGKKGKSAAAAPKRKDNKSTRQATNVMAETNTTGATKNAAGKKPTAKLQQANMVTMITPAERLQMIEKAAYYLAERRGFIGGDAAEDWSAAEREIDKSLQKQSHEAA